MKLILSWITEPVESTLLQVPRALVVSALAALLDLTLLVVFVEVGGWHPLVAATVSYLLGGVVQYVLSSTWVFNATPQNVPLSFAAFTFLSLVGLAITWMTMSCLHDFAQVHYGLAKIFALGLAFAWNFLSRKYWLFKTGL